MSFLGRLLRNVLAVLAAGSLVAWWVYGTVFPNGPAGEDALRTAFLAGIAAQLAVAAAAIALVSEPLRRAASAGWNVGPEESAAAVRAGHRLPVQASVIAVLASAAAISAPVLAMRAQGLPADLALAAAAVGVATAILSGMLAYSAASSAAARASVELGAREVAARGTVRGKILVLGFGLNTIGVLLFAATGYVRYRGDVDQGYVASAMHAQRSAIAAARGAGGAELARQVWNVTSSPSALVAPDGEVRASFGARDVPFQRARGAPAGSVRLDDGWLVTAAAPGGVVVASWLPEAPLWPRRRAFWAELATAGLVVYAATAVLAWLAARAITFPLRTLGRAADRIASGDLTAGPPSLSRDEMGQLAAQFRRMADGLKALVVDVQAASEGVSSGAREAASIGDKVRSGALGEHEGVVAMQAAVEAMDASVHLVSRGVGGLSEYVSQTTSAMGEMAAAFEEVQRKGADLQRAMDAAMRDVEHLAAAGRDAEVQLGALEALAAHAGASLGAVRSSMSTLERAASESDAGAQVVAEAAERAGGVVDETVQGIETLRAAVSDAHRRIAALGRRSDDIDQVVDFIGEVAGRTNLLSLNASIIASQAGEHGKAFSVVADQIRELAAQIARSTKSIGDIIHAVREDVEATAALVDRGDALAVEGVQLARNSLEALGQIRRSTAQGRETAAAIHSAVDAHGGSWREVSQLVESVANGSRAVSGAVQLVGRSVAGVNSVSKSVNAMAEQVARALEEQAGLGRRQMDSLARLERMIVEITRAVQNHDAAARRVRDALQHLSRTAGEHESAVEGLSGVAERLGSRARALADSVGRFKV
jgi:methyl-accepting chemotaxis protein